MTIDAELLSSYYSELRKIARGVLSGADGRITIEPTELVNEAAARLLVAHNVHIRDETHFLALSQEEYSTSRRAVACSYFRGAPRLSPTPGS